MLLQGPGTPTGRAARLKPERVWVQIPPWVFRQRRVRKPAKRPSSNLGDRLRVRLPPLRLEHASAGHWRAQVAVTHPHCCAGSTPARRTDTARSSIGSGPRLLTPARGVRFPYGLLTLTGWWNRQTRSSQKAVPSRAWEFKSPPGHSECRRAGARQTLIRSARPARYRGLQLLTAEYANQAKRPSREGGDFVGSTPTSATDLGALV